MNDWKRIVVLVSCTSLGYLVNLISVVLVFTKNDNIIVFFNRVVNYGEKTLLSFVLCCLFLALPFLKIILKKEGFQSLFKNILIPGSLVALSMNVLFFVREAFLEFNLSSSTLKIWWWILKQSSIGFVIGLPTVLTISGVLAFYLDKKSKPLIPKRDKRK